MFLKIEVEKSLRERIPYPDISFPFCVWIDIFNQFLDYTVNCHWHYDFEYGYVLSGSVDYYINDTYVKLQKGDCLFVNSNMLHMGRQSEGCHDAVMFTVTFPASLLSTNINSSVYTKYFQHIIEKQIEGFAISSDNPRGQEIRTLLNELYALDASGDGYELNCLTRVIRLWIATLQHIEKNKDDLFRHTGSIRHVERAKEILSYIHTHYQEKITVADIARDVNISRSECFRSFKRFMNKKPVEYINEYRLLNAAKLLRETEMSISDICMECGFESTSYFGKLFRHMYATTPLHYRKIK